VKGRADNTGKSFRSGLKELVAGAYCLKVCKGLRIALTAEGQQARECALT